MSRPQEHIDHIRKFRCYFCGAEAGQPCYQRRRGSSYRKPMGDFHMARTQAAYPDSCSTDFQRKA